MPSLPPQPQFSARFAVLADIRALIAGACDENGIGRNVRLRMELAIEELFTNTIHYGYGTESDRPVWIAARGNADGLEIEYQDEAPAFDPFGVCPTAAEHLVGQQAIGGFGCLLVQNLASRYRYQRVQDRNRITLYFRRDEPPQ